MIIDIEERTICVNLEKEFKNISFKRKFKSEIKQNIINFIKFKTNQHLLSKPDSSPINLVESSLVYLSKHFIFSTSSDISFDKIVGIKSSFFDSEKDNILSSINPVYFDSDNIPSCLKNDKEILYSKHFVLTVALNSFFLAIPSIYITQNREAVKYITFDNFLQSVSKFLTDDIPLKFRPIFDDLADASAFRNYFITLKEYFNPSGKDSFYGNHSFRDTAKLRLIHDNKDSIFPILNSSDFSIDKDSFFVKFGAINYHRPNDINSEKNVLLFDFIVFLFNSIDFKKAYSSFNYHFAPDYLKSK